MQGTRRPRFDLRLLYLGVLCGLGCTSPSPSGPEAGSPLERAVQDWQAEWAREGSVAVGNFVDREHSSGSAFGRYLQQEVSRLLAAGGTPPANRRELETQLVSAQTSLEHYLGATRGVGGVRRLKNGPPLKVWGDYQVVGEEVEVQLSCSRADDSEPKQLTVRLPLAEARRHGALLPPNHDRSTRTKLALAGDQQDFRVELWVDRGVGGSYELGAPLLVLVRPERECYVKIVHVASDGTMQVVFPNRFDSNNRLAANAVQRVGGLESPFEFTVSEPVGEEALFAYASTHQFEDIEQLLDEARREGVVTLGQADPERIQAFRARGLTVSAREGQAPRLTEAPQRAFSSTTYVVLAAEAQ